MKTRPPIDLAVRFPTTWLFLHGWIIGDFSGVANRYVLTRHHEIGWVL